MSLPDMPCQEIVEVITEYFEGTLPEPDRARFEIHLAGCESCRIYLEQMRRTIAVVGMIDADVLPEGDKQRLVTLFRDWTQAR
jgi:anti-sigma factor RsiW